MNDNPGGDAILAAELEAAKQTLTAASYEGLVFEIDSNSVTGYTSVTVSDLGGFLGM